MGGADLLRPSGQADLGSFADIAIGSDLVGSNAESGRAMSGEQRQQRARLGHGGGLPRLGSPTTQYFFPWRLSTGRRSGGRATRAMKLVTVLQIACAGLILSVAACLPASAATRHVVLLFDERVELPGLSRLEEEFVRTLRSSFMEPIEVYREPMDLSRFGSDPYKALLRDFLRAKYANKQIDVAVAVMASAFDFLSMYGDTVFPGASIVFCGLDRTQLGNRSLPPNTSGVLVKREFAPTLALALRLHPTTERIVVVSGTSEFDTRLLAQAREEFRSYESRVSFTYLSEPPLQQLLSTLSQLPRRTIILFVSFFQDGIGQPFIPHEVVERISTAASVPVYGFVDQYVGRGIVGGRVYSFTAHGADTARMALRVLAGDMPPRQLSEVTSSKDIFDWRQMLRWGIAEGLLPSGAEIRFRDLSVWQTHAWQITGAGAVLVLQAMLIAGLLYERRRALSAELQARQRMSELAHVNRFSTAGELTASIAHEINQPLGSILANVEALQLMLKSPSPDLNELHEIADDIRRDDVRAGEVIQRLRSLLKKAPFEAKPVELNEMVRESLALVSSQIAERQVDVSKAIGPSSLPVSGDRIQIQQVMLNVIVNAMDAMSSIAAPNRRLAIWTSLRDDFAEVAIADNGPGVPPDKLNDVFEPFFTTKAHGMGMGLSIARTIIEAHNGTISAHNQATGGAVFRIRLPLRKS